MINTSIYKSEFQKMIRNNVYDGYVLQEGCDSANEAYLAPSLDIEKFNQAMEKDCLFRKYATKFQVQRPDGTVVTVASSGAAEITATGQARFYLLSRAETDFCSASFFQLKAHLS